MISAETVDGRIRVKCGKASGMDLICEAAALVTSVVKSLCADEDNPDVYDEELARTAFRCIVTGAGGEIGERTGIDVFAPLSNDADNDYEEEDDSDGKIIAKAIPIDSDTGRKLMELLGIDPDEVKPKDDDETKDDIPDFLF